MARAITRTAAARELSCSERTIGRLREAGLLDEIVLGARGVRICAASLEEYIERGRNARRRREGVGEAAPSRFDAANLPLWADGRRPARRAGRG